MKRSFLCAFSLVAASVMAQVEPGASAADVKQLKACEASYASAKSAFTKTPTAKSKKAYVDATVKYGTCSMTTPALGAKVKYKQALKLYREALKHDPKNAEAKNNSEMIISIYKSMGRPVPKD